VDSKIGIGQTTVLDYLPNADSFRNSETGIRELIGRVFYKVF